MRACGGQLSGCLLTSRGVEIIDGDDEWSSCYVHLFPCVNVPCLNLADMKCTKYLKCGMIDLFQKYLLLWIAQWNGGNFLYYNSIYLVHNLNMVQKTEQLNISEHHCIALKKKEIMDQINFQL